MDAVRTELPSQDEDLIRCYLNSGCRDSADELANRYIAKIHSLIRSMVLDEGVADDLTQETFLRAFRGLSSFEGNAQFSTWLYRIAMNTVHSYLKQQGRSPVMFQAKPPEPTSHPLLSSRVAEERELQQEITVALSALSSKLRAAIVLTCIQDKSPSEAAEIEGCSVATMYWRIHSARNQLKKHLARHLT